MVGLSFKSTGSEEFHQIVDFLADSHIRYALTANSTIYVYLIEQFWQTATVKTINDGEQQITVTVDGYKFAITEASIRRHLQLADVDGISFLPNTEIFEQLSQMGYLSDHNKLTFKKAHFTHQIEDVLILPRYIKRFLNAHNAVYVAPSLKQKLFSNMKIGFSGKHVPLFGTMLLHDQPGQGDGPTVFVESQHTPTASSSSTSQPTTSQPTSSQAPSSHEPTTEPITTTSSPHPQETQIPQTTSSMPHDSPLPGGYTPGSVEGSMQLKELTNLCTKLVARVTSLETELKKTKEVHGKALTKLVKKVKRLEDKLKSTNERKKAKMVISDEEEELVSEDSSKQGRMEETEYADVEEENAGVEYDFDLTEQQVTPLKAPQVEVQSQETFEAELSVLSAAKILCKRHPRKEEFKILMVELRSYHTYRYEEEYRKYKTLFKKIRKSSKIRKKRVAEEALLQESFKKLRTTQASGSEPFHQEKSTKEPKELSEEDLKKMLEIDQENIGRLSGLKQQRSYQGFEDNALSFLTEKTLILYELLKKKFRYV
ncbi:hypothetical protein Tco_0574183 [Tanacetum coccineum]